MNEFKKRKYRKRSSTACEERNQNDSSRQRRRSKRDAAKRGSVLAHPRKEGLQGGCEYPTASSSHGNHLLVSDYNRGVSLTT
jgi:hypothetical protein